MENTKDKSFEKNNSDKPFIRTMEDDLKKIKNEPLGKDGVVSGVSSYSAVSSQQSVPLGGIKRPAPFQFSVPPSAQRPISAASSASVRDSVPDSSPFKTSASSPNSAFRAPVSNSRPAPAPSFLVPKNLPINDSAAEEYEDHKEMDARISKPIQDPRDLVDANVPDSRIFSGLSLSKEKIFSQKKPPLEDFSKGGLEKFKPVSMPAAAVFKPIAPASASNISRNNQSAGRLIEEAEPLSPEARLARQSSMDNSSEGIEPKETPARSLISKAVSDFSEQLIEPVKHSNPPFLRSSSGENRRRSIEEIIKEDNSNSFFRKFSKVMIVVLVILGVSIGAFYYYISKNPTDNNPAIVNPSVTLVSGATEVVINADVSTDFNDQIVKYFSTSKPSGIYNLILKDKDGKNYLPLENFGNNLNIVFPEYVANALEKDYNLIAFNYPEKNYLRLGLVLKAKNSVDIMAAAKKWESGMYKNLKPIFLDNFGIYDENRQFGSNKHSNFDIRYLPLGFENIGLNYAIDDQKKYLLIATSKQDIFSLIDNIIKGK